MFGFGDAVAPNEDAVELVDELVKEYIIGLVWMLSDFFDKKTQKLAEHSEDVSKLKVNDLLHVIRKDFAKCIS